jgi:uncharacterized protein
MEGRTMTMAVDVLSGAPMPKDAPLLEVRLPARRQLIGVAAFVLLCLGVAGASAAATGDLQLVVPFLLALSPAAFVVGLAAVEGHGSLGRLRRMVFRRPADRRWYLTLLIPIGWALAVVAAAVPMGQVTGGLLDGFSPAALIIPLVVVIPAFAEEFAWRGYAVPRLLAVMSPLAASLVLAVPWAAIHMVLLLPGGANAGAEAWPSVLSLFAYSVILTWAFVGTGGSVLIPALIHTGLNSVVPLMRGVDPEFSWAARAVLAAVIAAIVIAFTGIRKREARS